MLLLRFVCVWFAFWSSIIVHVNAETDNHLERNVAIYFDKSVASPCETVVFLGVGTAMRAHAYSELSNDIVHGQSITVVIVDDNPVGIRKQDPKKFASVVNTFMSKIQDYVPNCSNTSNVDYIVGGHSGGGEGAIRSLPLLSFSNQTVGFIGLAPYKVPKDEKFAIKIPALIWDFSRMSCAVQPRLAGKLAYEISNKSHRVFYQRQTNNRNVLTRGPHCSFADHGCMSMCTGKNATGFRADVGRTVHSFIEAVKDPDKFTKEHFKQAQPADTVLFVNENDLTYEDIL